MATLPKVTGVTATTYLYAAATIAWNAVPGAISYQVQYRERGLFPWLNGGVANAPSTYFNQSGLKVGVTYEFRVIANGA